MSAVQAIWCSFGLLPAGGDAPLSVSWLSPTASAEEPWFQPEGPAYSVHFYLNI